MEELLSSSLEWILLAVSIVVIICVIRIQIKAYSETKKKINQLADFFPKDGSVEIKETSVTREILNSKVKLANFLKNIPPCHVEETPQQIEEGEVQPGYLQVEYIDVSLIKIKGTASDSFADAVNETNAYLCKNAGTSADFPLLQDICERKTDALETQISNSMNVPLYWGLVGTFAGIIIGLAGIAFNVDELFKSGNMSPLRNLLFGVVVAMVASSWGLVLMIKNSAFNYKEALNICDTNRNAYYDFLRRELMPVLSNSMASSLNSLKSVLGDFVGKFGHNLQDYVNSAELLNENIEQQHLLLVEINKMEQKKVAVEIAQTFNSLREAAQSLEVFRQYQDDLNGTMQNVESAVSKIDNIIESFDDFSKSLNVVVGNQEVASTLQQQFRTAIETHFPTGAEARELWRKQYDELSEDATKVTKELIEQFSTTATYIKDFTENNKGAFESLTKLHEVLNTLVEYTNVQATCYKDLKQEIANMKKEQADAQSNYNKLNADLLTAVREMIAAIKTIKN